MTLEAPPADYCNADSPIVVVQHFAAVSTSTAYSTSEVTVWACASTASECPEDSSTSLVSVVTAVVPVSTTICPLTVTSVTTSGLPGTNTGILSTVTVSASSGTIYTIPASSPASNVSSVTGPPSASAPSSIAGSTHLTLHSTVTSLATITVPATLASTPLGSVSSLTGTLVVSSHSLLMPLELELTVFQNATTGSVSNTVPVISYLPPGAATTTTEVSPVGSTAYGSGAVTTSTNGTLATPTLATSTESIVPFTGAAMGQDYKLVMACMVVAVGSAVLLF